MSAQEQYLYNCMVRNCKDRLPCTFSGCDEVMLPRDFKTHFEKDHGLLYACVWCGGKFRWKRGETKKASSHRLQCSGPHLKGGDNCEVQYKKYQHLVSQCKKDATCFACAEIVPVCEMEKHLETIHQLKDICVWCEGRYVWSGGRRADHVDHLRECYNIFKISLKARPPPPPQPPVDDPPPPVYPHLYEAHRKRENLCLKMPCVEKICYGNIFYIPESEIYQEVALPSPFETFGPSFEGNLQLALEYVRRYMEEKDFRWYHIMVSVAAYPNFLREIENFGGDVHTLPFWCLCDGGKWLENQYKVHRHMILFTRNEEFNKECWMKIKVKGGPKNFCCKRQKRIKTWWQLINTIIYVSNRRSRCNFSFTEKKKRYGLHHFYINLALPEISKLSLALAASKDGLQNFLTQKNGSKTWIRGAVEKNRKWKVRIYELMKGERYIVLPVEKHWRPLGVSRERGDNYLHLGKYYLNFEIDDSLLSLTDDEWLRVQLENGNNFYTVVENQYWTMSKRQQEVGNVLGPAFKQLTCLELQLADYRDKMIGILQTQCDEYRKRREKEDRLVAEHKEREKRLQAENEKLNNIKNNSYNIMNERILALEAKLKRREAEHKQRESILLAENTRLTREINDIKNNEIKRLNELLADYRDREARLTREINDMKNNEIKRLNERILELQFRLDQRLP